jgi:CheY-like chemotaxis protein
VSDDGIGIAPDMLTHIFDLFGQVERSLDRAQGGLGIGLTLVKSLAELHDGSVQAFSPGLGRGSEFVVCLPALNASAASAEPRPPDLAPPAPGRPLRVLVVEDNTDTALAMGEVLEIWGHEVRLAYDGLSAIEVAQAYQPQVILLDIGLPGMDGLQVARALRLQPQFAETLLVATSGYGQAHDLQRSLDSGMNHHFTKPIQLPELEALLNAYARRSLDD